MAYEISEATPNLAYELRQALEEQSFGIRYYSILGENDGLHIAEVGLFDDLKHITVAVSERGWEVMNELPIRRYPTLDDLLRSVSPLYAQSEQERLFSKLEALSRQADDTEDDDVPR